jgi:hypothetical protein
MPGDDTFLLESVLALLFRAGFIFLYKYTEILYIYT